jgi:hypothetical protein
VIVLKVGSSFRRSPTGATVTTHAVTLF